MKLKEIEQETEPETRENPSMASALASDVVLFGGGAVVTNIALESGTEMWLKQVSDAYKDATGVIPAEKLKEAQQAVQNSEYMAAGGKTIAGILLMWASAKYVSSAMWKKLGYGVATGFFVSASSDVIEAMARPLA